MNKYLFIYDKDWYKIVEEKDIWFMYSDDDVPLIIFKITQDFVDDIKNLKLEESNENNAI